MPSPRFPTTFVHRSERGAVPILIAAVVAVGLGTALYVAATQTSLMAKHGRIEDGRDRNTEGNISTTAYLKGLVQYAYVRPFTDELGRQDPGPDPTDAAALPMLYPDPYWVNSDTMQAGPLAPVRQAPAGALYRATANNALLVTLPAADKMRGTEYERLARSGTVATTARGLGVAVTGAPGSVVDPVQPYLIRGLNVQLASQNTQSAWKHNSTAVIPLPRPGHARCKLSVAGGPFAPNTPVPLTLSVVGVAVGAYLPGSAKALYDDPARIPQMPTADFTFRNFSGNQANSVRNTTYTPVAMSPSATVLSPRIIAVVDSDSGKTVTVYAVAYVKSPDDTLYACGTSFEVKNVAGCRLSLDNFSIQAPTDPAAPPPAAPTRKPCVTVTPPASAGGGAAAGGFLGLFGFNYGGGGGGATAAPLLSCESVPTAPLPAADPATNPNGLPSCSTISYLLTGSYNQGSFKLAAYDGSNNDITAKTITNGGSSFCPKAGMRGHFQLVGSVLGPNNTTVPGTCIANIDVSDQNTTALTGVEMLVPRGPSTTSIGLVAPTPTVTTAGGTGGTVTTTSTTNRTPGIGGTSNNGLHCPLFFGSGTNSAPVCQAINLRVYVRKTNKSFDWNDFGFCPAKGADRGNVGVVSTFETNFVASSPWSVEPCPDRARCFALEQTGVGTSHPLFAIITDAYSPNCKAIGVTRDDLGCFDQDTLVRMADGSLRRILAIKSGDLVWNPVLRKPARVSEVTIGPEHFPLIRLVTKSGLLLRVTKEHPVPTRVRMKPARAVRPGDEMQTPDGSWQPLTEAEAEAAPSQQVVVNLRLAADLDDPAEHMLEAGGLISGDLYLQEQLSRSAARDL